MPGIDSSLKPLPSDHQFTIEEYNYENKTHYQPCVKASFYFKKRADISHDEFFKHWSHVHSDLTLAAKNFGQFQCQRYTQHHQFPDAKKRLTKLGMRTMDFDGCSTLWFKSWDDFEAFFTSQEYEGKLLDDCKRFMDDETGVQVFAGQDVIIFGRGIPGLDDKDGVTVYSKGA